MEREMVKQNAASGTDLEPASLKRKRLSQTLDRKNQTIVLEKARLASFLPRMRLSFTLSLSWHSNWNES